MTDETPMPSKLEQARHYLALACHALYGLILEAGDPAERAQRRATHAAVAARLAILFPPEVAAAAERAALEWRQVRGREPTADEVSDTVQAMVITLVPLSGEGRHDA